MTKFILRTRAIELRQQGKSYGEIKRLVKVSKSSLSLWLSKIPLSEEQIERIKGKREKAIEKFRKTMRLKREKRLMTYYKKQRKIWSPLSKREMHLAGVFLYWGEGNKSSRHTISISNTDPLMLIFTLGWMTDSLKIPITSIKVALQLYSDMDVKTSTDYWSRILKIPVSQFNKPYIKNPTRTSIDQKGFGHGTCTLLAQNTVIKENILMTIKSISDFYSEMKKI